MPDVKRAIDAMIAAYARPAAAGSAVAKPLLCLSRDHGTPGDDVAGLLAQRLGVQLFDQDLLRLILQRADAEPEAMRQLDEGAERAHALWLYSLFTRQDLSRDTFRRHLVNVILGIGHVGGVIVGRGAHVVLARTSALRVRLSGSPAACARRLATAQHLDEETARTLVETTNHGRAAFVWDTFHVRLNDPTAFDLTINTDRLDDPAALTELILQARAFLRPE